MLPCDFELEMTDKKTNVCLKTAYSINLTVGPSNLEIIKYQTCTSEICENQIQNVF